MYDLASDVSFAQAFTGSFKSAPENGLTIDARRFESVIHSGDMIVFTNSVSVVAEHSDDGVVWELVPHAQMVNRRADAGTADDGILAANLDSATRREYFTGIISGKRFHRQRTIQPGGAPAYFSIAMVLLASPTDHPADAPVGG